MKEEIVKAYSQRNEEDFWNWRDVVEKYGIQKTLEALEFPSEPKSIYYNQHTGSEETLEYLMGNNYMGKVPKKDQAFHLAIELEHWLPKKDDPNPVIAESLKLTEEKTKEMFADSMKVYVERWEKEDEFISECTNMGGSLPHGGYDNRGGKGYVELYDGRTFTFSLKEIWDWLKKPRTQRLFDI